MRYATSSTTSGAFATIANYFTQDVIDGVHVAASWRIVVTCIYAMSQSMIYVSLFVDGECDSAGQGR